MGLGEVTYENLLNSPSRGNLVDGLPRAASDCWLGVYLNNNYGDMIVEWVNTSTVITVTLGVPHGGSRSNIFDCWVEALCLNSNSAALGVPHGAGIKS